jgi:hypothetical protein
LLKIQEAKFWKCVLEAYCTHLTILSVSLVDQFLLSEPGQQHKSVLLSICGHSVLI